MELGWPESWKLARTVQVHDELPDSSLKDQGISDFPEALVTLQNAESEM